MPDIPYITPADAEPDDLMAQLIQDANVAISTIALAHPVQIDANRDALLALRNRINKLVFAVPFFSALPKPESPVVIDFPKRETRYPQIDYLGRGA